MATTRRTIRVLMLPWLAHGHIGPFLELAKKLCRRNFHTFLCSSPVNLSSIKIPDEYCSTIELVELHVPSLPGLPPQYHTTRGLPPHLMPTLKMAFDITGPNLSVIIDDCQPDLLIFDYLLQWAPEVARSRSIPAISFSTVAAGMNSYTFHFIKRPGDEYPFKELSLKDYWIAKYRNQMKQAPTYCIGGMEKIVRCNDQSAGLIFMKAIRELEGKYIDYLRDLLGKKVVLVGPLVEEPVQEDGNHIIEWLDQKERSSTIFVSFGTEYFLAEKEREEIAFGLELSNVNFIWVVKFPMVENVRLEEALPEGFLERVRDRGLVIEGWAPQTRVLAHPSVGGFVSHCGWSSVMESMKFGVPIIAMPMHLDQPFNARLVEDFGVGLEVMRNESGELERKEIAEVIKALVVEEGGEGVRKKVKEVSVGIRNKGDEEIDEVEDALVKLCVV
ncbi:beta-D-glucosyl crocetin beta-1,6-glucosyltransferase-like [Rhodamnia argentea]|uniref:Glycosyltransferase n=1 Tax=Rhodamnia argentea TaxID=178133 RepID=A0A8B8NXS0_9MYRT|nr:beta-D-glucosyl crocetin beta-1,6-glucosyltransferase-like [Rhodamnia argentea]